MASRRMFLIGLLSIISLNGAVNACFGGGTYRAASGIKLTADRKVHIRCDIDGTRTCKDILDGCGDGIRVPTNLNYTKMIDCNNFNAFHICFDPVTGESFARNDIPSCNEGELRFGTEYFLQAAQAVENFPTQFIRCVNTAGQFVCRPGNQSSLCPADFMMQNAGGIFTNYADCLNNARDAKLRCYDKAADTYSCLSDLVRCGSLMQLSNSLQGSSCSTYFPEDYARCAVTGTTPTVVKCRPAEKVTWVNSNTADTSPVPLDPLSSACSNTEVLLPFNSSQPFGKSACEAYIGYRPCYDWITNTINCSLDWECLPSDQNANVKQLTNGPPTSSSTCAAGYQTTYRRCVVSGTANCRPEEAGCANSATTAADIPDETNLPARSFINREICEAYPLVAGKWIRCHSGNPTDEPYCSFEACRDEHFDQPNHGMINNTDLAANDWATEMACKEHRLAYKICYRMTSTTTPEYYYSIEPAYDHVGTSCAAGDYQLLGDYTTAGNVTQSRHEALVWYKTNGELQHQRCRKTVSSQNVPVCRPQAGCPAGETPLITTGVFGNITDCTLNLWQAINCYNATLTTPYYEILAALDTEPGCPGEGTTSTPLEVVEKWYPASSSKNALEAAIEAGVYYYMDETRDIEHHRCKVVNSNGDSVAVCRPDIGASGKGTCASIDVKQLTLPTVITWSKLQDCMNQLYWTRPCYQALNNTGIDGNYYSIDGVPDTEDTCGDDAMELQVNGGTSTRYFSGNMLPVSQTLARVSGRAYYTDTLSMRHYRCRGGTENDYHPVCRPRLDDADGNCASFETDLDSIELLQLYPRWASLGACERNLHFQIMCYHPDYPITRFYGNPGETPSTPACFSDLDGCPVGSYRYGPGFGYPTETEAEWACGNDTTEIYVRCETPYRHDYVCRPLEDIELNPLGCLTGEGEVRIYPSDFQLSLANCTNMRRYILCYEKEIFYSFRPQDDADFDSVFSCRPDYNWCDEYYQERQVPGGVDDVDTDDECDNLLDGLTWRRCETIANASISWPIFGSVTCRPNTDEVQCKERSEVEIGPPQDTVELCLAPPNSPVSVYCQCDDGTDGVCEPFPNDSSGCCDAHDEFTWDEGSYFRDEASCLSDCGARCSGV